MVYWSGRVSIDFFIRIIPKEKDQGEKAQEGFSKRWASNIQQILNEYQKLQLN